jgi:hypothetical protein
MFLYGRETMWLIQRDMNKAQAVQRNRSMSGSALTKLWPGGPNNCGSIPFRDNVFYSSSKSPECIVPLEPPHESEFQRLLAVE